MEISYLKSKGKQMTKNYLKKCSTSLITCEKESKTTKVK